MNEDIKDVLRDILENADTVTVDRDDCELFDLARTDPEKFRERFNGGVAMVREFPCGHRAEAHSFKWLQRKSAWHLFWCWSCQEARER